MVKFVPDKTGRFPTRPDYQSVELDEIAEGCITQFMDACCGGMRCPIPTDALTKLIERDTADLDIFADLSHEGPRIEGVTYFQPGCKPVVHIAEKFQHQKNEHRYRSTLAHEYGHVTLHAPLYEAHLPDRPGAIRGNDWMERQANYFAAALLMPAQFVSNFITMYMHKYGNFGAQPAQSGHGQQMTEKAEKAFLVSCELARLRLVGLGHLSKQ